MYKKFQIALASLIICTVTQGQEADKQLANGVSSLSVEIGKSPMIGSFVFDRNFADRRSGIRAFAGFNLVKYRPVYTMAVGVYRLVGLGKHHFEIGSDMGYIKVGEIKDSSNNPKRFKPDFETSSYILSANAGYRLEAGRRHLFRLGLSPTIIKNEFFLGGYFSVGIRI